MQQKMIRQTVGAILLVMASVCTATAQAQEPTGTTPPGGTAEVLTQLRRELETISARISALEAQQASPQTSTAKVEGAPVAEAQVATTGADAVKQAASKGMDTMDAGMGGETINIPHIPQMKFRGFGDVRGLIANQNLAVIGENSGFPIPATQGGNNTFALGLMDLFITSQITDHFSYLTEMGFEADAASNGIGVDLERAQLTFTANEYFSLNVGRSHAMIGYYNTAFHHGTWFQTTIDRPRMYEFEDSGGPLPIHNVGLAAMGKVPKTGSLGLHWLAEVGNGKQSYNLLAGVTPANVLADHTGKSTNVGLYARPTKIDGLQFGFDWYQAGLVPVVSELPGYGEVGFPFPNAVNNYHQNIYTVHAVYITPKLELMAEDSEIRDLPRGSTKPFYMSGGYVQASRVVGPFRPYVRFQWMNPNFNDPNNAWAGRWVGPTGGVRWDLNAFIGWKMEFTHYAWKNFSEDASGDQLSPLLTKSINQLGSQITYTF